MLAFPAQISTEYKPADRTGNKPQRNNMKIDSKPTHNLYFPTKVLPSLRETLMSLEIFDGHNWQEVEMC